MLIKNCLEKILAFSIISLFLSGCMTPYPLIANGPHAQLGFTGNKMFTNESIGEIFSDYNTCKIAHAIPMFSAPMSINANQFTTILVGHIIGYTQLYFTATFYPQPEHIYLIATNSTNQSGNIITTMRILDQSAANRPIPLVKREYQIGSYHPGACLDDDIDVAKAPKVYFIQQTAQNVPLIYQAMEKTK